MAEQELIAVPSGMLRISRDGEADRVIYPVHADGWRRQGWTVHPPLDLDDEDTEDDPDAAKDSTSAGEIEDSEPELPSSAAPALPELVHPQAQPTAPTPDPEPDPAPQLERATTPEQDALQLDRMTKSQIVAAVRERHGVVLDDSSTRAELVAQAQQLEAKTGGTDADAATGDGETDAEAVVPNLLI